MKIKVLFAAAIIVAGVYLLVPGPAGPAGDKVAAKNRPLAPPDSAVMRADGAGIPARADQNAPARTEVAAAERSSRRGQLVGRIPDAPWTAGIAFRVRGRLGGAWREHEAEVPVAADGSFPIHVPTWAAVCEHFELRIEADDPWYEPVYVKRGASAQHEPDPLVVHVAPVGVLVGEVIDEVGDPVPAARLCVFDPHEDGEMRVVRAQTNTAADGSYRLRVPAAATILLVALPMQEASISGHRFTRIDGAITDCNLPREDLLPACTQIVTRFGGTTEVPPLRLAAPAEVTGRVFDADGTPIPDVGVVWLPQRAARYLYVPRMNLGLWEDGSMGWTARATTDGAGRFRLPATAGKPGTCFLADAAGHAEPLVDPAHATPPADLEFRVQANATLRVVCASEPVPGVRVFAAGSHRDRLQRRLTDERGELRFLRAAGEACTLTLEPPGHANRDVVLPADLDGPLVIELPEQSTAEVRVEFEGVHMVRQVRMSWRRVDAECAPIELERFRNAQDGAFVVELPVGQHRLTASAPARAERRDTFIVTTHAVVDVPAGGADVTVPVQHGGCVRVTAIDARGAFVGGSVSLSGREGSRWRGSIRNGPIESRNVPAGTYELRVDLGSRGVQSRTVVVAPLEVADVRIELP